MKSILSNGYMKLGDVRSYFPDKADRVDKAWLWQTWLTLDEEAALAYYKKISDLKVKKIPPKKE